MTTIELNRELVLTPAGGANGSMILKKVALPLRLDGAVSTALACLLIEVNDWHRGVEPTWLVYGT